MFEENLSSERYSEEYADFILELQSAYCPSRSVIELTSEQLLDLFIDLNEGLPFLEFVNGSINENLDHLFARIKYDGLYSPQCVFKDFSVQIAYYTTRLSIGLTELFVPWYFKYNFNVFERIAREFEINLPPIPAKKHYEERFYYYGEICAALFDFREQHGLSPYELCAFLYDFAPKYIGGVDSYIIKDLPEPRSAFFIGGSKDDIFLTDEPDTITAWQCSPETQAGDMIVMYLRTPVSAVNSVWRSASIGFNDPFFYYYRCTYIAQPTKIKQITKKQLENDPVFKGLTIVRKNFQGINGVELKPSEYNHLMDIAKADVMRLEFAGPDSEQEFVNEKDVEKKLIKPLLTKLGYSESDYVQKLYIEIGNHNHALIPDFVLLPVIKRGHHSAFAHIEAKHAISSHREMEAVRSQARSYAIQLKAKYSIIASKDKICISAPVDDYTTDIFEASWGELRDSNVFSQLYKLIGRKSNP